MIYFLGYKDRVTMGFRVISLLHYVHMHVRVLRFVTQRYQYVTNATLSIFITIIQNFNVASFDDYIMTVVRL